MTATGRLAVLFVCGADLTAPSEKQALWLGRELARRGHRVMLSLHGNPDSAIGEGADVPGLDMHWHRFLGRRVRPGDVAAARRFTPDLIHAWSSRTPVVAATRSYARAVGAPICVHWEDDEWGSLKGLPANTLAQTAKHLLRRAASRLDPPQWNVSNSWSLGWVNDNAVAFDALTPKLVREVRDRTGRNCRLLLPAAPPEAWEAPAERLGLLSDLGGRPLLLYTGDINAGRLPDVTLGLQAIAAVQQRGWDVAFAHAGRHTAESVKSVSAMAADAGMTPGTSFSLGNLPYAAIPQLLRQAAILLQPGRPTDLNRFGLPSKLQSYLASGTPCITFAVGAGELLEDRVEVLKTHTDQPGELADRIVELLSDEELRRMLSENGPRAARRLFDPDRNTEALLTHYRTVLSARAGRSPDQHSG